MKIQGFCAIPGFDVVRHIESRGYEAYFVGGVVRDLLLGCPPRDVDVTTDAPPSVLRELFPEAPRVGSSDAAIWVVSTAQGPVEIASHGPASLEEDLRRRDFTVNALALKGDGRVIDLAGGVEDLGRGLLRWNGSPENRLQEDPLRALRLVRFAATLPGFVVVPGALEVCGAFTPLLAALPGERIGKEMRSALGGDGALLTASLARGGLWRAVLPEVEALRGELQVLENPVRGNLLDQTVRIFETYARRFPDLLGRTAALLHAVGSRERGRAAFGAALVRNRLAFWCWPKEEGIFVEALVRCQRLCSNVLSPRRLVRLDRRYGFPWLETLLVLALAIGLEGPGIPPYWEEYRRIVLALRCHQARGAKALLSGTEIMAITGLAPGPAVGVLKRALYEEVALGFLETRQGADLWLRERQGRTGMPGKIGAVD